MSRVNSPLRVEGVRWGFRRPGWWRRLSGTISLASALVGGLLLGTNGARLYPGTYSTPHHAAKWGAGLLFLGGLTFSLYVVALLTSRKPAQTPAQGSLALRGGQLVLSQESGEERITLAHVESGWEDALGRAVLRLRDGRELTLVVGDAATAELLHAAGVTPEQRVARFPVGSALAALPGGRALGCAGLAVVLLPLFFALSALGGATVSLARGLMTAAEALQALLPCVPFALGLVGLLALLAPRRAVVGTDGVAIEGLLRRRFLPFEDITEVRGRERGVHLRRRRGWDVRLPHVPGGEGLEPRIRAAMAAQGQGAAQARLEMLDRRGRPLEEWLADLRRLADGAAGYRAGALPPEQLAAVVEDASVSPERRIAAAVSVAASGDVEARRRVRFAARTCADEELRAALEEAAEAERAEAALERAARR